MKVKKIDIWMGEIKDETGGLAAALAPLVATGVDFSFVIGTRRADKPGAGTVYFGGLRREAGEGRRAGGLCQIGRRARPSRHRADQPRLLHRLASELAGAGINLRSVSASVIKSRRVMFFAFDAASDRDQAALLLGK